MHSTTYRIEDYMADVWTGSSAVYGRCKSRRHYDIGHVERLSHLMLITARMQLQHSLYVGDGGIL